MLGGNASTVQRDRTALLEHNGYKLAFTMLEMEGAASTVHSRPFPPGVMVRPARSADAAQVHALAQRVWAGRPYVSLPSENSLRGWLNRSDLSLFRVAIAGGRMVGFTAAACTPLRAEIEDVQVDPSFQRRSLATALVTDTMTQLAGRASGPVRLHTEGHDPAGARLLYERIGFVTVREHHRFRRPLFG